MRVIFLSFLILGLISCGSSPQQTPVEPTQTPVVETVVKSPEKDASYFLAQARQTNGYERQQWLLKAADSFDQASCQKGLSIAALLLPELESNVDKTQANLIIAECLIVENRLDRLVKYEKELSLQQGFDKRINAVRYALYKHQNRLLASAEALASSDIPEPERSQTMWALLSQLSDNEFEQSRLQSPILQPWLQLNAVMRRYAADSERLSDEVARWQRTVGEPQSIALPISLSTAMQVNALKPNKIAVILPLTGRLAPQGNALKDGILSAYFKTTIDKPELIFVDSALPEQGAEILQNNEYQLVIGPLIKDNIQVFASSIPEGVPVIALNRDEEDMPEREYFYYSLAPEDEAIQLAKHLESGGLKEPIIVAESSSVAQRMKSAFIDYWQGSHQKLPIEVSYNDSKTMRNGISAAMGIALSKQRIRQINALVRQEVYAFERNRRDIDSIVVFANSEQTELINPVIETNISPFADILPVFASSRSHSLEMSNNSYRDLRNLNFIDLPWMLPEHPWQGLSREAKALWPQRTDTDYRLFAMGYDVFNMIPHLRHMALFPEYDFKGLTGTLTLNNKNQVKRELPWGRIEQERVVQLDLD
ncbi:penicillin-binding protein activator [Alteromonadaceae bacterium M269]|nr:penicillin-binding protein activator [Alteromonadaceae bacterium M269]